MIMMKTETKIPKRGMKSLKIKDVNLDENNDGNENDYAAGDERDEKDTEMAP